MAKKKVTEEQVVEPVIEETKEVQEAPVEKKPATKKKRTTTKKKVEVPAEEVVAVDDKGAETPLTEIVPETAGETVTADVTDAEVATSFIEDVEPVKEQLDETPVEEKPAPKKSAPKKAATKKPAEKKDKTEFDIKNPVWCYPNAVTPRTTKTICGKVYLWDKAPSVGRYAVTDKPDGAGNLRYLCGWVKAEDLGL